jgi:hypothetical protein
MDPEQMYFMEGFTLMDAMSAFEVFKPPPTTWVPLEQQIP